MASEASVENRFFECDQAVPGARVMTSGNRVASYKNNLIACYELLRGENLNEVTVEAFCGTLLADKENPRGTQGNGAAFLTALLETFNIETREGSRVLRLSPTEETEETRHDVGTCMREDGEQQLSYTQALARRLIQKRLADLADVKVRVLECAREGEHIKIHFHLKQDEAKLCKIMTKLAITDLGKSVKSFKGLICAAPCNEEMNEGGNYARAIVIKVPKKRDRHVQVRFLDFGFVDYVEKASLRKLPAEFLKTRALGHTAVVVNTRVTDRNERQSQASRMMDYDETLIRVLKYNKERKFYEAYVYKPSQRPDI